MSFGFSVGDFLAVGKLVKDIVSCLKDSGGSRTDYQDLIRELECLDTALAHLNKLTGTGPPQDLTSIKYAALSCRRPLEEFLGRIRKYDKTLGIQSRGNSFKGVVDKIRFPFVHKDEVQKLQAYLNVHVGSINILLAEYGLETMQLAAERAETSQSKTNDWLKNTGDLLSRVRRSVVSQTQAVFKNMAMLESICKILSGELKEFVQSLGNAVAKVCVSTQQIYAVVLEIRTSIAAAPDIRWTFLQDPLIVEDALGRKFPVPSEYDYSLLDSIIKHKFQDGPGSAQVAVGDYEIMETRDRLCILSVNSHLKPGSSITMAVLVDKSHFALLPDERCPMPRCQSSDITAVLGGGKRCCDCDVWFDHSKKKLNSLADLWIAHEMLLTADQPNVNIDEEKPRGQKRKRTWDDDFSIVPFKNVKLAGPEAASRNGTPEISLPPGELDIDTGQLTEKGTPDDNFQLQGPVSFENAIAYVNRVKGRFQSTPEMYGQFLRIIQVYQREQVSVFDTFNKMKKLFHSAPELIEGFKEFLPPEYSVLAQVDTVDALEYVMGPRGYIDMVTSSMLGV